MYEECEKELEKGLLIWYPFEPDSEILLINTPDSIIEMLQNAGNKITVMSIDSIVSDKADKSIFDYVIIYNAIDKSNLCVALPKIKKLINRNGHLLIAAQNSLGIQCFCGEVFPSNVYSYVEWQKNLDDYGINKYKFFSVFPSYRNPQLILSSDYVPVEKMENRYIPKYENINNVFIQENKICDQLIENGVLHIFANSFLIECSMEGVLSDIDSVTLSMDRGKNNAMATVVEKDLVYKTAIYSEGIEKLKHLSGNMQCLKERKLNVVEFNFDGTKIVMPYIKKELANVYLQKLLLTNRELFIQRMDEFYKLICDSSEIVDETDLGPVLRRGFLDLVPLNCFWTDKGYVIFDQEYDEAMVPVNLIMFRSMIIVYDGCQEELALVPRDYLYKRYGMEGKIEQLCKLERQFVNNLRADDRMREYNSRHQILPPQIKENYTRIFGKDALRYDEAMEMKNELVKIYREKCFEETENKRIYVWGAGRFADKFIQFYKDDLNIVAVVDNNPENQGNEFYGYSIISPDEIINTDDNYKVIICVKAYDDILAQLQKMNISNIGIYDAHYVYKGRQNIKQNYDTHEPKKYHIGYISGVFDLFHIGHINMFKRAKEQCDYLIAAVTSDEYVRERKGKEPYIPFDERLEVVKSCRYVDEAVGVPYRYAGTIDAFQKYHFDVQFCGSDYADNPWWLEQKRWLETQGATLVFFSYTEQTSSTKIRELIERGLL